MGCGTSKKAAFLSLVFALRGVIAAYGFIYPRARDQLWLGQEINLAWASKDEYVSLTLLFDDWTSRRLSRNVPFVMSDKGEHMPIVIAANISNTQSYLWTIPTNISEDTLKSSAYFSLANGITEVQIFATEQLYIFSNQSQPPLQRESKLGRFTTSVLAPGKISIKENTPFNITWDTPADYIKLSVVLPGDSVSEPLSLLETTKNPGFFQWEKITPIGLGETPQIFRLESNDSQFANLTLDSETYYVEPQTYPSTTLHSFATPTSRFIYPLKDDLDGIYTFDTYVFEWWPPLEKGTSVIINAVCETYKYQTSSFFTGRTSFTSHNLSWQVPFESGPFLYDCPIHFNLIQINPQSAKWDWSAMKLVARSDIFPFKGKAKVGGPKYLSEKELSSRLSQLPHSKISILSKTQKIVIGVVLFIGLCILFGGIWRWWIPQRQKKLEKENEKTSSEIGTEMPIELDGDEKIGLHEMSGKEIAIEGDYDMYIRELEDSRPAAEELDAFDSPAAELEGGTLKSDWRAFKAIPVITVDSPK